jgi:DNA-3-methyladenine glycosylase II
MDRKARHSEAIDRLIARDPHLAAVVEHAGRPELFGRPPTFATLVLLILEQQVSIASAAAAFGRLQQAGPVEPASVLLFDDATLREFGFSRQKTRYVRALSLAVLDESLDLPALMAMEDDAIRSSLTALPGIGPWTVDVFLLECVGRPDVWPSGDRALAVGTAEVLGLETVPAQPELDAIGSRWSPDRSTAAQLIWHHYLHRRGRTLL